jgi:hypothetical protein
VEALLPAVHESPKKYARGRGGSTSFDSGAAVVASDAFVGGALVIDTGVGDTVAGPGALLVAGEHPDSRMATAHSAPTTVPRRMARA